MNETNVDPAMPPWQELLEPADNVLRPSRWTGKGLDEVILLGIFDPSRLKP